MRAWHLGAILTLIGFVMFYYALNYAMFTQYYTPLWTLGIGLFFLGIAILGLKLRQWVEHH